MIFLQYSSFSIEFCSISVLKLITQTALVHLQSEVWNEPYGLHGSGTFVLNGRIPGNEGGGFGDVWFGMIFWGLFF